MSEYMDYNTWLEIEVKRLNNENKNIKHFFSYDELDFLNEITELKKRISKLEEENYELQNGLIKQQLTDYDNIDYINKLKKENKELNEFINHVKELSNYHERKKLEYKEENGKLKNKIFNYYN